MSSKDEKRKFSAWVYREIRKEKKMAEKKKLAILDALQKHSKFKKKQCSDIQIIHPDYKGNGIVICKTFGCGKPLSLREQLMGNKCISCANL